MRSSKILFESKTRFSSSERIREDECGRKYDQIVGCDIVLIEAICVVTPLVLASNRRGFELDMESDGGTFACADVRVG